MGQRPRPSPVADTADDVSPRDDAGARIGCACAQCETKRAIWMSDMLRKVEVRREVHGVNLGIAWEAIRRREQQ
jgi:hypothetical protein